MYQNTKLQNSVREKLRKFAPTSGFSSGYKLLEVELQS